MASKTISVTEEIYSLLSRLKLPHESFGDVIKRLCEEKTAQSISRWAQDRALWSDMPEEEFKQVTDSMEYVCTQLRIHEVDMD